MLVSDEHRFIFVHVQKTGGSSLRHAMQTLMPDLRVVGGTHDTWRDAVRLLGESRVRRYCVAGFVRNPWDRLVSWYAMIAQRQPPSLWARLRGAPPEPRLWRYVRTTSRSFEEFVVRCTREIDDRDGRKSFCRNQMDYLSDERGALRADFVGRYESLADDAAAIFARLGLAAPPVPHVNASRHRHYATYYSAELADLVGRRFARDASAFGYAFPAPAALTARADRP